MTDLEPTPPFVGRQAELDALRAEFATVQAGRPRLVLLEGPAGIGKSAIIDHFLANEPAATVLRATGEQWEAFVAYGIVEQLMRSAGVSDARLLASRNRSLPTEEPAGVGARVLEVLEDLEQKAPVVLVVDDAHWADIDSLRTLLFAARRLVDQRVLTLIAQRDEEPARLLDGLRRMAAGRTGTTLRLAALPVAQIQRLAAALGVQRLSTRAARRLHAHTRGNPLHLTALLGEIPVERWRTWEPVLPAPSSFAVRIVARLDVCSPGARRLIEAASVLGTTSLASAALLGDVPDPIDAVEEAVAIGVLALRADEGARGVTFAHPLIQAAVYEELGPAQRIRMHAAAARLVEDEASALRHRVMAVNPPDPALVADLDSFARRQAAVGAWAPAAWAMLEASRLSPERGNREERLLMAVDAMIGAGDLIQAEAFAQETVAFAPGPLRNAALGYLAVLRGQATEAERLLRVAWEQAADAEPALRGVIAQRLALHSVGRLRGRDVVAWAQRSVDLAPRSHPVQVEAQALLGLGLGWEGRLTEGLAAHERALDGFADMPTPPPTDRVRMAHGRLQLVSDDVLGAHQVLAQAAPAALATGSVRVAVWSYAWLARTGFVLGRWDEAAADADRAVALLEESGHAWLRPLAHYAAASVAAARGDGSAADEHARGAAARSTDYELMIVTSALAGAQNPAAQGDHDGVRRALQPIVDLPDRQGVDEPGFWPWPDLYADALVSAGHLDEAETFLRPHEEAAAARGRGSMIAGLARARGRLDAARGRLPAAEDSFRRALAELSRLPMPFLLAQVELAYGQVLRRAGSRRAAAEHLQIAHAQLAALQARPYLERCERELAACGLSPAKRTAFVPSRLTAQELAVARLVAAGMSNRQVASELFISIKTVQFHLTHIYAKLGVASRGELAAQFRESELGDLDLAGPDGELGE